MQSNSQSPLNLPQSYRFDLKQTTTSVSSSHKSLPKTGSATSSDSLLTKDLRNRFRMIMDEIKPPQSSRSASSSTLTSTPTSTGFEPATVSDLDYKATIILCNKAYTYSLFLSQYFLSYFKHSPTSFI